MAKPLTNSAKITRPAISSVLLRERLFTLLDRRPGKQLTWVAAPGGTGKSTLIASYLDVRRHPCIWYHCDDGDADPATFFYYMGLAVANLFPHLGSSLPLLTPEYLGDMPTFTRRYFESLGDRLISSDSSHQPGDGFIIVLDNYQEVPPDSPFHDMLATGMDMLPHEVRLVVASRHAPPPRFSRLGANGRISHLYFKDLKLTLAESLSLVRARIPDADPDRIAMMHERADGWTAGMILLLESASPEDGPTTRDFTRIFDYFATELFSRIDNGLQCFLIRTSFLPSIGIRAAETLTGNPNAGTILASLHRNHLFTERLGVSGEDYAYHPLLRSYLQSRVRDLLTPEEIASIRLTAAGLLESGGEKEEAARLYCQGGAFENLTRMIKAHAQELLTQGRRITLEEWISCIPEAMADSDPWVLFWTGYCAFPMDLQRTRVWLRRALASFLSLGDTAGIYLSWAGIVDTFAFSDQWNELDGCIATFHEFQQKYPPFPTPEIELTASSRMLLCLTLRMTDRPTLVESWLQRVSALLQKIPAFHIQIDTVFCMSVYYLWKGEYEKNAVLLDHAVAALPHIHTSPFAAIRIKLMKGIHYWVTASYVAARRELGEGLGISARTGVHIYDSLLWSFTVAAELATGDADNARSGLQCQMSSLVQTNTPLARFFYHVNSAWLALLDGTPNRAAEHLETVFPCMEGMGAPYYRALWHIGMAQARFMAGRIREAGELIAHAYDTSLAMKSHVLECYSLLVKAWFLLTDGEGHEGVQSLGCGLSLGRCYGFVHLEFYQPAMMSSLCARALDEGIETEYVRGLIKRLALTPPLEIRDDRGSSYPTPAWPYPLRIHTLGTFEIFRHGELLAFPGKEQKKPLEMLKVMLAYGGRDLARERVIDILWPDAEGDLANKSFETTLSRLRKLLGEEECIIYRARKLSLNPLLCWVDTLTLETLLNAIEQLPIDRALPLSAKAVNLFSGHFLATEGDPSWALCRRETEAKRVLRVLGLMGSHHAEAGEWESAADFFARGIEIDDLAEDFYRRLMISQLQTGNHSAAVRTFHQCRSRLKSALGIEPSPETRTIYSSITRHSDNPSLTVPTPK